MPPWIKACQVTAVRGSFGSGEGLTIPIKGANLGASSDSMMVAVAIVVARMSDERVYDTSTRHRLGE